MQHFTDAKDSLLVEKKCSFFQWNRLSFRMSACQFIISLALPAKEFKKMHETTTKKKNNFRSMLLKHFSCTSLDLLDDGPLQ